MLFLLKFGGLNFAVYMPCKRAVSRGSYQNSFMFPYKFLLTQSQKSLIFHSEI